MEHSYLPNLVVRDLGLLAYREAWAIQEQVHAAVMAGGPETILIVEHPAVITWGRRGESIENLLVSPQELRGRGVEVVHSDRGGDVTYHGPGQIVAYPIIRLAKHSLSVSGYVHRLEEIVIAALAVFGIVGTTDKDAVGVWTWQGEELAKICAIGVRIRRGITLHGLALNATTNLSDFGMIVPCGLSTRRVTSVREILRESSPTFDEIKSALIARLTSAFE